jgi:hypothetical protein
MDPKDAMAAAQGMGLALPSPAYIFGILLFSLVGFAAWRYGKVIARPAVRVLGVALMVYPYFVGPTWAIWLVGCGLCAATWWVARG